MLTPDVLRDAYGAEMVVLRQGRSVYVVEHDDAPLDSLAADGAEAMDELPREGATEEEAALLGVGPAPGPGRAPRV